MKKGSSVATNQKSRALAIPVIGQGLDNFRLHQIQTQPADPHSPPSPIAPMFICPNPMDNGEANGYAPLNC